MSVNYTIDRQAMYFCVYVRKKCQTFYDDGRQQGVVACIFGCWRGVLTSNTELKNGFVFLW